MNMQWKFIFYRFVCRISENKSAAKLESYAKVEVLTFKLSISLFYWYLCNTGHSMHVYVLQKYNSLAQSVCSKKLREY